MAENNFEMRETTSGQNFVSKMSCQRIDELVLCAERYKEDITDVIEELKLEQRKSDCPTRNETIYPADIIKVTSDIDRRVSEGVDVVQKHLTHHADSTARPVGGFYDGSQLCVEESQQWDDYNMRKSRKTCVHMKHLQKVIIRFKDDMERHNSYLKLNSDGGVSCERSLDKRVDVEDIVMMLNTVRQLTVKAKSVFMEHIKIHSWGRE